MELGLWRPQLTVGRRDHGVVAMEAAAVSREERPWSWDYGGSRCQ